MKNSSDPIEINKFAELAAHWWDTSGPLKTLHDINPARTAYLKKSVPDLNQRRILDVGTGGGIFAEAMAREGAEVTGLDPEEQAIKVAQAHAQQEGLSIHYEVGLIEHYQAKPFSIMTCMEMLEHVSDPELILTHAARLLAPDGYLFLSTINRTLKAYASVILGAEYLMGILPRQTHDFQKFIKPSELAAAVRAVGLHVVDICGLSYHPFTRKASLVQDLNVNYLMTCRFEPFG